MLALNHLDARAHSVCPSCFASETLPAAARTMVSVAHPFVSKHRMKLIIAILAFVAVVTGFATMPANATTPERMTYGSNGAHLQAYWGPQLLGPQYDWTGRQPLAASG